MGALRTYRIFEQVRLRTRLAKLNTEHLRKAAPRLWERLQAGDEDLAQDLAQAVLVSNMTFVVETLDFLGVPHDGSGFFQKDSRTGDYLTEGWQQRVLDQFRGRYPEALVRLYINHLMWDVDKKAEVFAG